MSEKTKKIDLEKVYFGVMIYDFNEKKMKVINVFNSVRVLRSIALYVTRKGKDGWFKQPDFDPFRYCFLDTAGRVEWEFLIGGIFQKDDEEEFEKMDVYTAYLEPNKKLLMDIVNNVTEASAKRILSKYKR